MAVLGLLEMLGGSAVIRNAWGFSVPIADEICRYKAACYLARDLLSRSLRLLGFLDREIVEFLDCLFAFLGDGIHTLEDVERLFHTRISASPAARSLRSQLRDRARLIAQQIRPFVVGPDLIDVGCGDGLVAAELRGEVSLRLADVFDYRDEGVRDLSFCLLTEGAPLPYASRSADTVLLLTVLHHSFGPELLIEESIRVARRRVVIIESVFDVCTEPGTIAMSGTAMNDSAMFVAMNTDQQLAFCSFVDWFYNRVLHDDVPVPYNFNRPDGWRDEFRRRGSIEKHRVELGIDQLLVPEFHTLHFFDVV